MVGIVLLGVFVVLLVFGAPIAVCLGMSSVGAILAQGAGKPLDAIMSVLPRLCSSASSKFVLLAIPFFILSGNVMEKAGISGRLINLAEKCLGHIRGGMAMVCVVVSCFFAAISGSGPATVAALGLIMIPALVKAGYPAAFSCALMAAGGAIGVVIPPSITFVVYGSIADASITDLFKAGVIPGLLMGAGLIVAALVVGRKMDLKVLPVAGLIFVVSRILSSLALSTFPKANKSGSLSMFSDAAQKRILLITLALWLIVCAGVGICLDWKQTLLIFVTAAVVYGSYYRLAMKQFGGTTGDIAGFFTQICELACAFVIMLGGKLL